MTRVAKPLEEERLVKIHTIIYISAQHLDERRQRNLIPDIFLKKERDRIRRDGSGAMGKKKESTSLPGGFVAAAEKREEKRARKQQHRMILK